MNVYGLVVGDPSLSDMTCSVMSDDFDIPGKSERNLPHEAGVVNVFRGHSFKLQSGKTVVQML